MCIEYYVYSLDEEMMEIYYEKTLERDPLVEKRSKLKNEQVEELQSKLEKKAEIMKELESIQERKSCVTLQLN